MKRLIEKAEYLKICELYNNGMTHENIGKIYGVDRFVIGNVLRRCGIKGIYGKSRIYPIDETLFEKIDCEWKAWFLGWAYSDGNVSQNSYEFSINLSEKDKCVLDTFNQLIYSGKKPLEYKKGRICKKTGTYTKASYRFRIMNKKICHDLINLGVVPAKSLIITWPKDDIIPKNLIRHFIRGIYEGDGTIHINEKKYKRTLTFLGTLNLLSELQNLFLSKLDIKSTISKNINIYQLRVYDMNNIDKIMHFMYDDVNFILLRKKKFIKDSSMKECDAER